MRFSFSSLRLSAADVSCSISTVAGIEDSATVSAGFSTFSVGTSIVSADIATGYVIVVSGTTSCVETVSWAEVSLIAEDSSALGVAWLSSWSDIDTHWA